MYSVPAEMIKYHQDVETAKRHYRVSHCDSRQMQKMAFFISTRKRFIALDLQEFERKILCQSLRGNIYTQLSWEILLSCLRPVSARVLHTDAAGARLVEVSAATSTLITVPAGADLDAAVIKCLELPKLRLEFKGSINWLPPVIPVADFLAA